MALARGSNPATIDDFLNIPEDERFHELLAGEIVQKALPTLRHGGAQGEIYSFVRAYRRSGPHNPGGWVFACEGEIELFRDTVVRPDVAGWHRERMPRLPETGLCTVRPDWVCEILSRSNAGNDLWDKMGLYHQAGIGHYWIVDPATESLRVFRWAEVGYQMVLDARAGATVRAEPFEAVEIALPELFDAEGPADE